MVNRQQCEEKIRWVASAIHESAEFRRRAQTAARDIALSYAAGPLLHQAKENPQLAAIVEELQQAPKFNQAVEDLTGAT